MKTNLVVSKRDEESDETVLSGMRVLHADCGTDQPMSFRRRSEDDRSQWNCACGLEITFPRFGDAYSVLEDVASRGTSRDFPQKSFWSNLATSVHLSSEIAGSGTY